MKCLKCAIKTNVIEKELKRYNKCIDCRNGSDCIECEDCGKIMVYCNIVGYYHDGNFLNSCMWFRK